jgi:EAL domain-containing protein (putative c-di-GMP-specific phosphodiesterase class I)
LLLTHKAFDPVATIRAVCDEGIRIVMRDIGVQPVALDKLAKLPLSRLRLHRRIVAALPDDRNAVAIADSLWHFGDGLGIELLAEGVKEKAQLEWLESRNWHVAQGTLLAAPLPSLGASELVKRANGD